MKYVLLLTLLLGLSGCYAKDDYEQYTKMASEAVKKACDEVGGTLATGVELTYTAWGTEITAGYYCINTKNPTGFVR